MNQSNDLSYTLITGSTGMLGQYVLRNELMSDARIAVIVRSNAKQNASERVESVLQRWEAELGRHLPRPVCIEGDVQQPSLGLDQSSLRWVRDNCRRMVHGAAVLKFRTSARTEEPWITNLGGTQNVLDFCRQSYIRDFHYISTAYVCGIRQDLVKEEELDTGQDFRNDYERSKFEAEQLVRGADFLEQLTIYRPAVISGDSKTGYTSTYHGLYVYLRLMAMLIPKEQPDELGIRETKIRLPMSGHEGRNVVPVDWVADIIHRTLHTPELQGATYHLAPSKLLTPRNLVDVCYSYFGTTGVEYSHDNMVPVDEMSDFERAFFGGIDTYLSYQTTDPQFDTTNLTRRFSDLPCPEIDAEMLNRYLDFGQKDRWGKRRSPKPTISFSLAKHFANNGLLGHDRNLEISAIESEIPILAFDVLGPGGGQWQIVQKSTSTLELVPGLPCRPTPILRLSIAEFVGLPLSHLLSREVSVPPDSMQGQDSSVPEPNLASRTFSP